MRPTVVVADIDLPGMSGLDLCLVSKSIVGLNQIPFVILSKHQSAEELKSTVDAGGVFYVGKSHRWDNLLTAVNLLFTAHKRKLPTAIPEEVYETSND